MAWWPNPTGIGAVSDQDYSNFVKNTAASTYAGGSVYLPVCEAGFPFTYSTDESISIMFAAQYYTWFRPATGASQSAFPQISLLDKTYYDSIGSDGEKLRKFQSWGCLANSIDDLYSSSSAYSSLINQTPNIVSSNTFIYQNEAISFNFSKNAVYKSDYLTGVLCDYTIVKSSNTFNIN